MITQKSSHVSKPTKVLHKRDDQNSTISLPRPKERVSHKIVIFFFTELPDPILRYCQVSAGPTHSAVLVKDKFYCAC